MTTTLNDIRVLNPEQCGAHDLVRGLEKNKAGNQPIPIIEILNEFGLLDAIWCLQSKIGIDKELRLFAVSCIEQLELGDSETKKALTVATNYASGRATLAELKHAYVNLDGVASHTCDPEAVYAALTAARSSAMTIANMLTNCNEDDKQWDEIYTRHLDRQKSLFVKFFG